MQPYTCLPRSRCPEISANGSRRVYFWETIWYSGYSFRLGLRRPKFISLLGHRNSLGNGRPLLETSHIPWKPSLVSHQSEATWQHLTIRRHLQDSTVRWVLTIGEILPTILGNLTKLNESKAETRPQGLTNLFWCEILCIRINFLPVLLFLKAVRHLLHQPCVLVSITRTSSLK